MLQNSLHSQPNKVLGLNKFKITMQGSHNTKGSIKHFLRFKTFISWLRQDWEIQHYNLSCTDRFISHWTISKLFRQNTYGLHKSFSLFLIHNAKHPVYVLVQTLNTKKHVSYYTL